MTAQIFLACFFGCLFALAFVALAIWHLLRRMFRKNAAEFLRSFIHNASDDPEAAAEIDRFVAEQSARRPLRRGFIPPKPPATFDFLCRCQRTMLPIPWDLDNEGVVRLLTEHGWQLIGPMIVCPQCVADAHEAPPPPKADRVS